MTDRELEREIRDTFRRRGADVRDPEAVPPAREALRLTRRRQLTNVVTMVVVALALVGASVAGASALFRSSERRVPLGPTATPSPPASASGTLQALPVGTDWSFDTTIDASGAVWAIGPGLNRFDPGSGASTAFTLADDPALDYVVSIALARQGGIWVVSSSTTYRPWIERPSATTVGRFDGGSFQEVLEAGPVCNVAEGSDGTLWGTGCSDGLYSWDGTSWVPTSSDESPVADAIAVDPSGQVWMANIAYDRDGFRTGLGLSRFDGTAWTSWTTQDGLPSDRINTIVPLPGGEVWVGTDDGVARYLDGSWTAYPARIAGVESVSSIAVLDGTVWVAGSNGQPGGIARFDGTRWTSVRSGDGLGGIGPHPSVAAGDQGVLWVSTNRSGLFRFDGSRWEQVAPDGSTELYQIAAVSSDELWAGAWHLEEGRWTEDASLAEAQVSEVAVAPDGLPWARTERGLERFDGSRWEQVDQGSPAAIAFAPGGTAWAASGSTIGPLGGEPLPRPIPLAGEATDIAFAPNGDVWARCTGFYTAAGCDRALARFDGRVWEALEPAGLADGSYLRDLEVTEAGDVWITASVPGRGGATLVALRYRDGTWTDIVQTDAGALNDRSAPSVGGELARTPDGGLLLLASDGLYALRGDAWSRVAAGAFSDVSVAPDGTVWLAGDGLFRLETP